MCFVKKKKNNHIYNFINYNHCLLAVRESSPGGRVTFDPYKAHYKAWIRHHVFLRLF